MQGNNFFGPAITDLNLLNNPLFQERAGINYFYEMHRAFSFFVLIYEPGGS
jgi:hypothetical protein